MQPTPNIQLPKAKTNPPRTLQKVEIVPKVAVQKKERKKRNHHQSLHSCSQGLQKWYQGIKSQQIVQVVRWIPKRRSNTINNNKCMKIFKIS